MKTTLVTLDSTSNLERTLKIERGGVVARVRQSLFDSNSNSVHLDNWGTFFSPSDAIEECDNLIAVLKEIKKHVKRKGAK